jgi:hypothetical protein
MFRGASLSICELSIKKNLPTLNFNPQTLYPPKLQQIRTLKMLIFCQKPYSVLYFLCGKNHRLALFFRVCELKNVLMETAPLLAVAPDTGLGVNPL